MAKQVVAKSKAAGKLMMGPSSPVGTVEYCRKLLDLGFDGISFATDITVFRNAVAEIISLAN